MKGLELDHREREILRLLAEVERLQALVREATPFMHDAGNDEDPEAQAVACAWLEKARRALEGK